MFCTSELTLQIGKVACGQCIACRVRKQREWTGRMMLEQRLHENTSFITLTYNDESIRLETKDGNTRQTLYRKDLQQFFKTIRYSCGPFRYFAVGEYGMEGDRPHYHCILYSEWSPFDTSAYLERDWGHGWIDIESANTEAMAYCAKYTTKGLTSESRIENEGRCPEFAVSSRRPGIGAQAFKKLEDTCHTRRGSGVLRDRADVPSNYRIDGRIYPIPKYYIRASRKRLGIPKYKHEREALALKPVPMPILDYELSEKQKAKAMRKLGIHNGKKSKAERKAQIAKYIKVTRDRHKIQDTI